MASFHNNEDVLFNDLQFHYNNDNESEMKELLREAFDLNINDVFGLVLSIATKTRFIFRSNRKSIPEIVFNVFQGWLKTKTDLAPSRKDKDNAMFFLVSYGVLHLDILNKIFQLDAGPDRGFLAKHLGYLINTRNELKEAAIIATSLNLQEYIAPTDLLLPLFCADKFQVAESYLKNSVQAQKGYADMLNMLCGMSEERLMEYIQSDLQLRIMDRTKFKTKTLQKISEKVVKKYQLEPSDYPKIFKEKNLKSLRYLVVCKYKAPEYEYSKWDGLIEAAVNGNQWLQEQLIFMLTYNHRDLMSAVHFARKCNIPSSVLPDRVKAELQKTPEESSHITSKKKTPARFFDCPVSDDDDDDDGFMFSADDGVVDDFDNDYDDASQVLNSINSKSVTEVSSRFWDYPLPTENIRFIDTCVELEKCMKVIFKPGNIIGFDGEWQPKYGRAGEMDKMAIMQLAVKEQVFIVDILAFDQTSEGQSMLRKLFELLFTSENTLRLGYGIDSDISVMTSTYEYVEEFLKKSKHFDDLAFISKQVLSSPKVIDRLQLGDRAQNERGLSQLVKQCLGKPLDKTYQVSNWEKRPLSEEQLKYAALDALCIIKIYDVFEDLAAEFKISVDMNEKSNNGRSCDQLQRSEASHTNEPPKRPGDLAVVCDTMLQGLGKSLRSCGVDTKILQNENNHMEAVQLCHEENRIILTKGRPFFQMRPQVPAEMCMSVPDGKVEQQVFKIFQRYNVKATSRDIFGRCQMCNGDKYVEIDSNRMMIAFWKKKRVKPKALKLSPFKIDEIIQNNNDSKVNFRYVTINNGINLQCEFIPQPVFDNVQLFFCCARCGKVYWEGSHYDKVKKQFAHVIEDTNQDGGMPDDNSDTDEVDWD